MLAVVLVASFCVVAPALASSVPTVKAVSPPAGKTAGGARVTVTGSGFGHVKSVKFGTTAGTSLNVISTTKLVVTAPKHAAGAVNVRVTTTSGTSAARTADHFAYIAPPTVKAVTPTTGKIGAGTRVTIAGTNFTHVTSVKFGTSSGTSVVVSSSAKLTVTAPAHAAGLVAVRITTAYGTSAIVTADRYTYITPSITSIAPATAPLIGGTVVTVRGESLTGATKVTFGGVAGTSLHALNSTVLTVSAPSHAAGLVAVQVTTPFGVSAAVTADHFTYAVPPVSDVQASSTISSVTLTWQAPPSAGLTVVAIYRASGSGPVTRTAGSLIADVDPVPSTFTDTLNLDPGTSYVYVLVAHDGPSNSVAETINATTKPGATISGVVTASADGSALDGAIVKVFGSGAQVASTATGSDGSYRVIGLAASADYTVCFDASTVSGGYLDQCYQNVPWNGGALPDGVTLVSVTSGGTQSGVDAQLDVAGQISGLVTAATGGAALGHVTVDVFRIDTDDLVAHVSTGSAGTYVVNRLPITEDGYAVCFDASGATGGPAALGYADQCFDGSAWTGSSSAIPDDVESVVVQSGQTSAGIDGSLVSAGALNGTITAVTGGAGLGRVEAEAIDDSGEVAGTALTDATGSYHIGGLVPDSYAVCFDAAGATGGSSSLGYPNQCFDGVAWDGRPDVFPWDTTIAVNAGTTVTVNAALPDAGVITGTVTAADDPNGSPPLENVGIWVFDSQGKPIDVAYTGADGKYTLRLPASAADGDAVCFDGSGATGGVSQDGGFLSRCYLNVDWDDFVGDIPNGATFVHVSVGTTVSGIDDQLPAL